MKNILLLGLVLVLVASLVLLWDSPPEFFFSEKKTRIQALPKADSYMNETITTKFAENGSEAYILKAKTGLYFHRADRFELEAPEIMAHRGKTSPPWQLRGKEAHTAKGGEEVILTGDVYGWQDASTGRKEMRTSELVFTPRNNSVHTDAKVDFKYPEGKTSGVGMTANFDTETYQLLSRVKGIHYAH